MAKRQSSVVADAKATIRPARRADSLNYVSTDYNYTPSLNPAHESLEYVRNDVRTLIDSLGDAIRRDLCNERVGNRAFAKALPQLKSYVFDQKNVVSAAKAEALRDLGLEFHGRSEYINPKVENETRESRLEHAIEDSLNFQLNTTPKLRHAKKRKSALDVVAQEEAQEAQKLTENRRVRWNKKHRPHFYGFLEGAHLDFEPPAASEFDSEFAADVLKACVDAVHIKVMADVVRCDELYQDAEEDSDWEAECDNNLFLAEADLLAVRDFAKQHDVELVQRKASKKS